MGWWHGCPSDITSPIPLTFLIASLAAHCFCQHSNVIPLPVHILSALLLSQCGGFNCITCSRIVSQTRLGAALPPMRQQHSPGHSELWVCSETGENGAHTSSQPSSRPVHRLLDEWSCCCNGINAKDPPNKSRLHSISSRACEVFLSSPLSLQTSLPKL